jgi:hypothetical protein
VLPTAVLTLCHADRGKDPGLESGFNPVLEQIQFLAENNLLAHLYGSGGQNGVAEDDANARQCRHRYGVEG